MVLSSLECPHQRCYHRHLDRATRQRPGQIPVVATHQAVLTSRVGVVRRPQQVVHTHGTRGIGMDRAVGLFGKVKKRKA